MVRTLQGSVATGLTWRYPRVAPWAELAAAAAVFMLAAFVTGALLYAGYQQGVPRTAAGWLTDFTLTGTSVLLAIVFTVLVRHMLLDVQGKWRGHVTVTPAALELDLAPNRSLVHRPPACRATVPRADIAAIETRLEIYLSLGMGMMQRPYRLVRHSGAPILLFESRQLMDADQQGEYDTLARDLSEALGVPLKDLGMVRARGGLLGVLNTSAPPWDAWSLPLAQQESSWLRVKLTGHVALFVLLLNVLVRALAG